jgi:tetratricopeptide (TPR) repeat protein
MRAQTTPSDPEVAKGVRQVDEGEYDAAIVTLDSASRRLAGDPSKARDLSEAYLYLGIAYVGKGHEAAAKAKFREAVRQIKDLVLSTDKYPPKVIDLFEAAREEVNRAAAAEPAATSSPAARPAPAPQKKGGASKGLIIGGVLLAGAGAAVAVAGGGGSSGSSTPADNRNSQVFTGNLPAQDIRGFTVTASKAGTLEATLTWQDRGISLTIDCQEKNPPYTQCGHSNRTTDTSALLTTTVTQKEYDIIVNNFSDRAGAEPFTLTVRYP